MALVRVVIPAQGKKAGVVIIGTGLAGYTVARECHNHDAALPISLISADGRRNDSRSVLATPPGNGYSHAGRRVNASTANRGAPPSPDSDGHWLCETQEGKGVIAVSNCQTVSGPSKANAQAQEPPTPVATGLAGSNTH